MSASPSPDVGGGPGVRALSAALAEEKLLRHMARSITAGIADASSNFQHTRREGMTSLLQLVLRASLSPEDSKVFFDLQQIPEFGIAALVVHSCLLESPPMGQGEGAGAGAGAGAAVSFHRPRTEKDKLAGLRVLQGTLLLHPPSALVLASLGGVGALLEAAGGDGQRGDELRALCLDVLLAALPEAGVRAAFNEAGGLGTVLGILERGNASHALRCHAGTFVLLLVRHVLGAGGGAGSAGPRGISATAGAERAEAVAAVAARLGVAAAALLGCGPGGEGPSPLEPPPLELSAGVGGAEAALRERAEGAVDAVDASQVWGAAGEDPADPPGDEGDVEGVEGAAEGGSAAEERPDASAGAGEEGAPDDVLPIVGSPTPSELAVGLAVARSPGGRPLGRDADDRLHALAATSSDESEGDQV